MYLWANLVIIVSAHQISDHACLINMWSWSQIMTSTQLIVFVNASVVLWSWNTADSYNLLRFSWKIWIIQVLIIIVQNIILSQIISYHKSCSLIWQHSVFVRKKQLSIIHCFYCIVRAHLSEYDQTSQLWECIQDQNWSEQILKQSWIIFLNYWTHVHM